MHSFMIYYLITGLVSTIYCAYVLQALDRISDKHKEQLTENIEELTTLTQTDFKHWVPILITIAFFLGFILIPTTIVNAVFKSFK